MEQNQQNTTTATDNNSSTDAVKEFTSLVKELMQANRVLQQEVAAQVTRSADLHTKFLVAEAGRVTAETRLKEGEQAVETMVKGFQEAATAANTHNENELKKAAEALKEANAKLEELKKNAGDEKSPGRRIVDRIGVDAASRFAEAFENGKSDDAMKAMFEAGEIAQRHLIDSKKAEGTARQYYHIDQSVAHWSIVGGVLVLVGAVTTAGYYGYTKGRERGHMDLADTHVTFKSGANR